MLDAIERGFFNSVIKLNESATAGRPTSVSPDVQILRVGNFNHPKYGEFEITSNVLSEMKANFDKKIRGIDIALDYFHDSDKEASGWLTAVYLSEDGQELWGNVQWTPRAAQKLAEREIRYFSPDFAFKWTDPESEITYQNVLFGGGLTNRPFVKDMAAIVASERKEEMDNKELEKKVLKLAEDGDALAKKHSDLMAAHTELQKKHGDLEKKLADMMSEDDDGDEEGSSGDVDQDEDTMDPEKLKKQLADMKAKCAEYEEASKKHAAEKQLAEKEKEFNVLLSEGKAVVAQKTAFMKGDMGAFAKLSQPVNLEGKGTGKGSGEAGASREDRIIKLAETKMKADPKLSKIDALTLANREVTE